MRGCGWWRQECDSQVRRVIWKGTPPCGRLTTMPTRAGLARGWWGDVESLGEPGDQQGEFHLGECEADAVASASTEGNPRGIGGRR